MQTKNIREGRNVPATGHVVSISKIHGPGEHVEVAHTTADNISGRSISMPSHQLSKRRRLLCSDVALLSLTISGGWVQHSVRAISRSLH
jgi:hypothetical protein